MQNNQNRTPVHGTVELKERLIKPKNGIPTLIINILGMILAIAAIPLMIIFTDTWALTIVVYVALGVYLVIIGPMFLYGVKILEPNEARVFTFFGKYHGTLVGPGTFYVNAWLYSPYSPDVKKPSSGEVPGKGKVEGEDKSVDSSLVSNTISLKTKTINNNKQKINDLLGNPIIVDTMVVWRIVDTAKAMFNVENYLEYLSVQCDAALRNIVSLYPYDSPDGSNKMSLRCSSQEIADAIKTEIQVAVEIAGLEVIDAKITNVYYAPEIANAMLQRQQASAVVDAKHTIVEGAVDIVEMALARLNANDIVRLDDERKAAMVSNLLVVLCGTKEAQPVVNSGSLY